MAAKLNENTQYIDSTTGELLVNGLVYIGANNLDAELNPITIYADVGLTTVLSNPQRIGSDGRVSNKVFIPGKYSLKVKDANNNQKLNDLSLGEAETISNTPLINVQGTNDIIADASPAIVSLVDGQTYVLTTVAANTGAMTLKIDTTTAYPIKKYHDIDMVAGDLEDHQILSVIWNSTDSVFELASGTAKLSSIGIDDNATSTAMTIDANEDISYVGTAQYAAGEGIVFNGDAIAAANTLDDYEEGGWTPTNANGLSGAETGIYRKVGSLVTCWGYAVNDGAGITSTIWGGLPFPSDSNNMPAGVVSAQDETADVVWTTLGVASDTTFTLRRGTTTQHLSGTSFIRFIITYHA